MILNIKDSKYPQNLKKIKNPPKKLYVKGDYNLLNKSCIAIVGTRKPSEYGIKMAKLFAKDLSKKDICIISGLAEGIDTYAHYEAKSNIGKTIAVLGGGINKVYPESNDRLANEILNEGGCIISEYEMNEEASMANFPIRNRIISGISMGVLIVEGRYRSGSSVTAKYAISQNKELFCIPHDIDRKTGYLTNELIKNGANLVTSPNDILTYFPTENKQSINEEYIDIYKFINNIPIPNDELCRLTNLSIAGINEKLMFMEIEGIIKKVEGGYVRV